MNTSFKDLKNNRQDQLDKLNAELAKLTKPATTYSDEDTRFWYPAVDKAGNGTATIRFLPAPAGEDLPYVRIFSHGFQGPTGSWYIENSLTTLNEKDPVSEYNSELWNSGSDANKDIARKQKRRVNYISNIYVEKDPANPENEGKVFLFKYGKKIFDKLNDAMNPEFDDDEPVNPFDLWEGASLKIKIRNVEGYRNYDKSEFLPSQPLFDDDKKLEAIWKQEYSLNEFLDRKHYKSYDELKSKLHKVLGLNGAPKEVVEEVTTKKSEAPRIKSKEVEEPPFDTDTNVEDEDFFKSLSEM